MNTMKKHPSVNSSQSGLSITIASQATLVSDSNLDSQYK